MNVIAEIKNNRSSSAALRKNLKTQQCAQKIQFANNRSLSSWKSKTFEESLYTKSANILDQQQPNVNKNYFINSHIQNNNNNNKNTSTNSINNNSEAKEQDQGNANDYEKIQFETSLSPLEITYFESLHKALMDQTNSLNNVPRVMSATKCSDTYKDVITSLIHDNLLSYTKYYENYFDKDASVTEMTSNSDELESFHGSHFSNSKKGEFNQRQNMRSALKQNKKRGTVSKVATFSDSINIFDDTSLNKKSPLNESYQRPVSMINFTKFSNRTFSITPEPNQSLQQESLNQSLPKSTFEVKKPRAQSADRRSVKNKNASLSRVRLSDSIFNGYQKKPEKIYLNKEDMIKSNEIIEEEEITVHRNAKEYKDISPFFKIKCYDIDDKKDLELAKKDLYQRYESIKYNPRVKSTNQRQTNIKKQSNSNFFINKNKDLSKVIEQI